MKYYLLLLLVLISWAANARKTMVTTHTEINNGSWSAGDTVVMKNGIWTDKSISFSGQGTLNNPVVLLAEKAGEVILNGSSKLSFAGKYIEINGLYFKNGTLSTFDVISFRISSSNVAENSRLTNTTIENYNPSLNTVDSKWVSVYGLKNKVDHCSFINKNNSGTLMVVWLTSGVTPSHSISDNYFGYRNSNLDSSGNELNGQEIIRVGDSSTSMTTASCTITGNFFEKCNGEIEVISNKSCGNLYKNNLFIECKGMLTLRHGNSCTVTGNYFFGNGISESGGVRIIGENHKVYNNYFDNLRGSNYRSAICMVRGMLNSVLNDYFQVKNALVAFNTMVNCSQSFSINYNSSSSYKMPPIGSIIAHNHVFNTISRTNVNINTTSVADMDLTWINNLMNMGSYSNFSYTTSQVIIGKDAKMVLVGTPINMYEPSSGSALLTYTTADYPEVSNDIRGRDRTSVKLPGASQLSGIVISQMPVKTEVGAPFYNNPSTALKSVFASNLFKIEFVNNNPIVESNMNGQLTVYDSSGKTIKTISITKGHNSLSFDRKGFLLFHFVSEDGQKQTEKIILY